VKLLDEVKNILKTGNTYFDLRMKFYVVWQLILIGMLIGVLMCFGKLMFEVDKLGHIFGL
jgi:membrane associated rhomboid family serine protease